MVRDGIKDFNIAKYDKLSRFVKFVPDEICFWYKIHQMFQDIWTAFY